MIKLDTEPEQEPEQEPVPENDYIRQLTLDTMINQDLLRKIRYKKAKESQVIFKPNFKDQVIEWIEQLLKDYENPIPKYEIPQEIRESFETFMKNCNEQWKNHWQQNETQNEKVLEVNISEWESDRIGMEKVSFSKNEIENPKEISMLPIYMKFQHPIWNNGRLNKKNGNYNHPHLNQNHKKSYKDDNMLFPESMDL